MKIPGIQNNPSYPLRETQDPKKEGKTDVKEEKALGSALEKDVAIIGKGTPKAVTYDKPVASKDHEAMEKLWAESDKAHSQLKELVRQLIENQGMTFRDLVGGDKTVPVDEATRVKAQEMIGEGGFLSAESVSERIVDFAKAISGGDKGKLETLRSAIDKGFAEAKKIFGGQLPEISAKTYDLIQEKLDAWQKE